MPNSKYFRAGLWILLIFLIILVGTHVSFVFRPLIILINTLFFPFFLAGILYLLTRPAVNWLNKRRVPRTLAIFMIYLFFSGLLTVFIMVVGPLIQTQAANLLRSVPALLQEVEKELIALQGNPVLQRLQIGGVMTFEDLGERFSALIGEIFISVGQNVASFVGIIANIVVVLVMVPFVLFYMLKEGHNWSGHLLRFLPADLVDDGGKILAGMDKALSTYLQSLITVSVCVGIMAFIGFSIIGLEYALLLSLVVMITNVIPIVGPFIGTIPAIIVALVDSPMMILKVLIVVLVAQQIESNLISPQIIGKNLSISPLIIIILLLVAGNFAGFLGMLLAVPTYAILRVVVTNVYTFYKLHRERVTGNYL